MAHSPPSSLYLGFLIAVVAAVPGCTVGGSRSASAENDRLRRDNLELRRRVEQLEHERAELISKIEMHPSSVPGLTTDTLLALPLCTTIEIDSFSGLRPADPAGPAQHVAVSFRPLDGRGRFTQVVGDVSIDVISVPVGFMGDLAPQQAPMRSLRLTPDMLRDAYRSGITGTYYEAELPLPPGTSRVGGSLLLARVSLRDALSTRTIVGTRVIETK